MTIELTTVTPVILSGDLMAATEALALNVRQAEPFVLYHMAREALEGDQDAQALLKSLTETQAGVRASQARGQVSKTDIEQLRVVQGRAQANRAITEYARTQQAALTCLWEVNREISELLGVDFAAFAKQGGCC